MSDPVYRAHVTPWEGPHWELTVHQAVPSAESETDEWWDTDPEQEPVLTAVTPIPSTSTPEEACDAAEDMLRDEGWHLWGDWRPEPGEWIVHVGREHRTFEGNMDLPPYTGQVPPIPQDGPGYGPGSESAALWKRLDALKTQRRAREADDHTEQEGNRS
ncbi:hypothetical protein ACFTWH_27880 [Streptomyces sp. NPDC057011]|uniref:hypothetical protein n=1 Tax=unclassified Streptomyces TaxID=2593676 RepID=UPI003628C4F7